jgi:hypothetical protein
MSEPEPLPKLEIPAVVVNRHVTYIVVEEDGSFHQAWCNDCDWQGPERDGRRYLAEFDAGEHRRAMLENWDG